MSGVGCVTEETRHVCNVSEAAIAEAKPVHGEVESSIASLMSQAKASTAHVVGVLSECVQEVSLHLPKKTVSVPAL